ncbi:DUF3883 domain-containing protein [Acinetobacter bereziniae]|uniref:DUF3883 domain-containing protein n=1 Tax=Acinetobacter bereziniae TaxID=106648 RepID=UPI0012507DA3|nr:DUF3883 domain-containing protein [Acinetobacter bereziniae]
MSILFCNIGWMEFYKGNSSLDQIVGGGAYVREKGFGFEVCNFSRVNDLFYGYVQSKGQIKIENLGAGKNDSFISGVTVIWIATNPDTRGSYIVGWYKNATVFRDYQEFEVIPGDQQKNRIDGFRIKAKASNSRLLSLDERNFEIPRAGKNGYGIGQSPIWYAKGEKNSELVKQVIGWVNGNGEGSYLKRKKKQDHDRKVLIEKSAIDECYKYYENLGYLVKSVEKDNLGWDLEATTDKLNLRIEVKGLSGTEFVIGLTPNEFKSFEQQQKDYRLFVVTNALHDVEIWVCRYSCERNKWIVENKDCSLDIAIKQSALISINQG